MSRHVTQNLGSKHGQTRERLLAAPCLFGRPLFGVQPTDHMLPVFSAANSRSASDGAREFELSVSGSDNGLFQAWIKAGLTPSRPAAASLAAYSIYVFVGETLARQDPTSSTPMNIIVSLNHALLVMSAGTYR